MAGGRQEIAVRPSLKRMCVRIARQRCPRCGKGAIFESFFVRTEQCSHCEWVYERGEGFWVGGSEVHMFASYGVSVVLFMPLLIILGSTPEVQAGVIFGHIVCSLLLFRLSRATFIGLDYFVDPGVVGGDGGGGPEIDVLPPEPEPRLPRGNTRPRPRRKPAAARRGPLRTVRRRSLRRRGRACRPCSRATPREWR